LKITTYFWHNTILVWLGNLFAQFRSSGICTGQSMYPKDGSYEHEAKLPHQSWPQDSPQSETLVLGKSDTLTSSSLTPIRATPTASLAKH